MTKEDQVVVVDGFTFALSENSKTIFVFKDDAFVTMHECESRKKAEETFKTVETKTAVVFE